MKWITFAAQINRNMMKQLAATLCVLAVFAAATARDGCQTTIQPDSTRTLTGVDSGQERREANHTVAGTWQYESPSVQAQGASVLGKLGKPIAKSKLTGKLNKAYKKLKIKKRWTSLRLDTDGIWIMTVAGKDIKGKYDYDPDRGTITLRWHLMSVTAEVERKGKHLHLLFDADRLLTLMRLLSGISSSDTLKALAFLSENYNDVKVGFRLKRK